MKPSNASRVGGRSSRTITAGISIRITPPSGMPMPVAQHAGPDDAAPNAIPYERATIAPVSSTQPTPSPMPSAAVSTHVRAGMSRNPSDSRR